MKTLLQLETQIEDIKKEIEMIKKAINYEDEVKILKEIEEDNSKTVEDVENV